MKPERTIEGQGTALSRTMHGVAYDEVNDEILIPVALGGAILVFRGDAKGEEAPIRVIQGSQTRLIRPQTIAVDPVHDEIIIGDTTARAVFVFDRKGNGDVAPKRVLYGDKTQLLDVVGVAVDPVRNVIVAASRSASTIGLVTFNRTDNGNVVPRTVISGPKTGLAHFRQVAVDPGVGTDLPRAAEHAREAARGRTAATSRGPRRRSRKPSGRRPPDGRVQGSSVCGTSTTTATCRRAG